MKKRISMKTIYLVMIISIGLIGLGIGSTYAMFTASASIENPIAISSNLVYNDEIIEVIDVNLGVGEDKIITLKASNDSGSNLNYTTWYSSNGSIVIGYLPETDNASGTISNGSSKTINVYIKNIGESFVNVSIGVSSGSGNIVLSDDMKRVNMEVDNSNYPELVDGMIPIKYNYSNDSWQIADITNTSNDWYNYNKQEWANAVLVTEESRSKYMSASAGTIVNEDDILAYYVWIPRYRYILFNVNSESINPREIQIEFEKITDAISNGTVNGEYLSHPAFWWDNNSNGIRETGEELPGIWVGKFETGGEATKPLVKPNITSMRGQNMLDSFNINKKIETTTYMTETGVANSDSHVIKNTEWGAVAYLSHSKYGTNKEININNNSNYITGKGVLASTTGNVTGIYDMSGGSYEAVMGVMKTSKGDIFYNVSGFNDSNMVESKYYDLYEYGNVDSDFSRRILGDATGETNGWYDDNAAFVSTYGWFVRSGDYSWGRGAGAFYFAQRVGNANAVCSTRSVLLPL